MLYPIELWVQPRSIENYEPQLACASEYLRSPVVLEGEWTNIPQICLEKDLLERQSGASC